MYGFHFEGNPGYTDERMFLKTLKESPAERLQN